jgi:hypothetical protein
VPAGFSTVIKQLVVTNTTGSAATFTFYIGDAVAGNALFSATSVAANDTVIINLSQVLQSNEVLRALASANSTLNITVSGVENDGPLEPSANFIANDSVTVNKIADGSVTSAKIADSLSLTGVPTAPTAAVGTNNTQLATTAFVTAADNLKANIASPSFTGTFNANSALLIDSSGRVTTPLRPAFRYHGWTMTTSGMQGGTAPLNIGSCLTIGSGGTYSRFTAPVAGLYFIGASCLIDTGAGRVEFVFTKNGSGSFDGYATYAINNFGSSPNGYVDVAGSYIFYLAAGDYIGMTPPVFGTLFNDLGRGDRMFQGFLIG